MNSIVRNLLWGGIILIVIGIVVTGYCFHRSITMEYRDNCLNSYKEYLIRCDSVNNSKYIEIPRNIDDSTRNVIIQVKQEFDGRLTTVLNDLRQSFNDALTLLSSEFAIWIAILTIIGGLIGVVLPLIQYRRIEKELDKQKFRADVSEHRTISQCIYISINNYAVLHSDEKKDYTELHILLNKLVCVNHSIANHLLDNRKEFIKCFDIREYAIFTRFFLAQCQSLEYNSINLAMIDDAIYASEDIIAGGGDPEEIVKYLTLINRTINYIIRN